MAAEPNDSIVFRVHAIERIAQRGITTDNVREVLETGEMIEDYPDDFPYPSALVLGWVSERPLHVVFAAAPKARIIITVYEPDLLRWEPDYRKRKP